MKRQWVVTTVALGVALAMGAARAQDAEALAKSSGCLECHTVAKKKVGPAFKELAKKFPKQGDKLLAALKADKNHADMIKDVKEDDLKTLANWIASL